MQSNLRSIPFFAKNLHMITHPYLHCTSNIDPHNIDFEAHLEPRQRKQTDSQWRTISVCMVFSEYPGIPEKYCFEKLIPLKPKIQYSYSVLCKISTLDCHY